MRQNSSLESSFDKATHFIDFFLQQHMVCMLFGVGGNIRIRDTRLLCHHHGLYASFLTLPDDILSQERCSPDEDEGVPYIR